MAGLNFQITADNVDLKRKLEETERAIRSTSKDVEREGGSIEATFSRMTKAAAAFGAGFTAKEFISQVMQVRGEMQQLEVAFTTMLGSEEKAVSMMSQLVRTAATTPFDLQSVANGARQLLAYGTAADEVNDTLVRLGNIAAGLSIPLNDLVYLYGTTMTQGRLYTADLNQFTGRGIPMIRELSKELGVAETEIKGMVEAGKIGFPEVQRVIQNLTNDGGMFFNLMQEQSKTITGQISNIQDSFSMMLNDIGKSSEGVINEALSGVSYLIENYEKIGEQILALVSAYGAYRAVLASVAAYQGAVATVSYSAEIAQLSTLIPQKQASVNADLEQAVASGKLTQSKAEQVAAMRVEAAQYVETLRLKAEDAAAAYKEATANASQAATNLEAAEAEVAAANMKYNAAVRSKNAKALERAETELGIAESNRYAAAKALEAARTNATTAYTNAATASKAAETAATTLNTASQTANTKSTNLLTAAKMKLIAASKALGLSMLANPYVIAAGAVAGLTYGIYKLVTAETAAEKAVRKHREEQERFTQSMNERRSRIEELVRIIQDDTETEYAQVRAYEELTRLSPALTSAYSREELAVASLTNTTKLLNEERDKMDYERLVNDVNKWKTALEAASKPTANRSNEESNLLHSIFGQGAIDTRYLREQLNVAQNELTNYERLKEQAEENSKPVEVKILEAKSDREQIVQEFAAAKLALEEEQEKLKDNPLFTIPIDVQLRFNSAQERLNAIDSTLSNLQSQQGGDMDKTYKEAYDEAKKTYEARLQALKDAKNGTKAEYIKAALELEAAEKDFKALGGVTDTKQQQKDADKQKDELQKLYEELLDLRFRNQQDEINLIADGNERKRKQIELDYQKEYAEISRLEKEWSEKGGGTLTQEQSIEISRRYNNADRRYISDMNALENPFNKEELEKSMNEYLAAYGDYYQKRDAIIAQGEARKQGKNEWEQKSIDEETKRALSDLDIEAGNTTSAISQLFGEMKDKTLKDLQEINARGKEALEFLKGGEWDEAKGADLGITKETFEVWSQSPEKLKAISDALNDNKQAADELRPAYDKVADGLKDIFNAGNDSKKLNEALADIQDGLGEVMQAASFLSDTFSSLGDAFGSDTLTGIADGINVAMDAANSAMQGAQAGAIFGGIGAAAGAAVGLVSSLASSIAKIHDKKNEKRIQRLQDQIDTLTSSYDKLGRAVEKAYSTDAADLIEDQNKLLEQQKVLIQQQIREEEDKKKTDNDRIKEWKQQLEEINQTIEDNNEKALESITGTDIMSAIDEFAQAYADAWANGTDAAKASTDTVKQLIRTSLLEFLKKQLSPDVEEFMQKLGDYMADGVISSWEQAQLDKLKEQMDAIAGNYFDQTSDYWKDNSSSALEQQSASSAYGTEMTQEQAGELKGRFTALYEVGLQILTVLQGLQTLTVTVSEQNHTLSEIANLARSSNGFLEDISKCQKDIKEAIVRDIPEIRRHLEQI